MKLGEELSGLSVMLTRQRTASISGVLRSATSAPSPLTLVSARSDEDSDWRTGVAGPDGAFSITGVLPGSYIVEAQSAFGNERATTEVKVSGTDVVGIVLTLSSGASARGQVRFESATPPRDLQPSQLLLFAAPAREGGISVDMPRPPVRSDWTFELTGLHGKQVLSGGTISGWHVKKVTVGGNDFTDSPIDFSNGDVNGIEVLLSNRSSEVAGQVTDSRGAMAGDASVVIFPADSNLWTGRRRYITASRPDQQGRFSIMGLPAARYLAIALDYLEEGEEYDPDLLKEWARLATSFSLGDGEARTVNLKITQSN